MPDNACGLRLILGLGLGNPPINNRGTLRHTLGTRLNRPSKSYPDYGSRVVNNKSNNVRPRIEVTPNVERD